MGLWRGAEANVIRLGVLGGRQADWGAFVPTKATLHPPCQAPEKGKSSIKPDDGLDGDDGLVGFCRNCRTVAISARLDGKDFIIQSWKARQFAASVEPMRGVRR